MVSNTNIPLPLKNAIDLGECVLFLGAGIGKHLIRDDGTHLPDAPKLAENIVSHFSLTTDSRDLSTVAELLHIRGKKEDLVGYIRQSFANVTPDENIKWLCARKWRAIFTTNYDRGIERGYELLSDLSQEPISISKTADLIHIDNRIEVPVYHIHGSIFGEDQNIVISQTDYNRFRESRRMLFELLKYSFATSVILYIGYSNRDPNWALLINEIVEEFSPSKLPNSYRVAPGTDLDSQEILKAKGIETIDTDLEGFVASATSQLDLSNVDDDRLKTLQKDIPPHFLDAFEKNPAPVARFLSSWECVNTVHFSDRPNIHQFFRGDKPNWSLIASKKSFRRDVEEDLYEAILDYLTSDSNYPTSLVALGPAGYGITTIIMNLAVLLVDERVGPIYYLKSEAKLKEGDVEFAINATDSDIVCFLIDNAADYSQQISNIISRLRDEKRSAVFVLGARINEWRQQSIRFPNKEFEVGPLTDPEISRLLKCLKDNNELNKLEPLTEELQFAVIRKKHGKELLVALREATEDKRFDAILEDEFFGINNEKCREIYLTTCCFHQYGCMVRDRLLAGLFDLPLPDFYKHIKDSLEGVVTDECIDSLNGVYAFRTRHRIISSVVWERCGEKAFKEDILQKSLENLNLNHAADANAFEKFVRNDHLIDSIRSLEGKIKFFETACKKDPDSPYVRQHYARMLYRSDSLELALSQVEKGIEIDSENAPRVLIHTKGVILGALAMQSQNVGIGRRRLAQAEEALYHAMSLNPRDSYPYQSLASIYLDWAKNASLAEESTSYITKAEEIISKGLGLCKEKDGLWIVSADIERWLGNQPSQLKALEQAVKATPGTVIGRYLLGKAYRISGRYDEGIDVLEPNVSNYPEEFRSCIQYSLCLLGKRKSYREAIAVLEIGSVAGLSDARYLAYLGGMHFLNTDFSKAKSIFAEAEKRGLPSTNLYTVYYKPKGPDGRLFQLRGKVIVRKSTFSLIQNEEFPPFFCHISKYKGLVLKEGMEVDFYIGFSPRGAVAIRPKAVE